MANPQLSVEITAKIDGLRDSFNKAIRETNNLDAKTKSALGKIDKNFAQLANDIDRSMGRASSSVSKASNSVSQSLAKTAVATSGAKNTYLELGRVLQDLPFGFTGIQNNLTQLVPAVGGLGLAFSGLISLITFLQVGTDYWTRGLGKNKDVVDALKLSGDEYVKTLEAVRGAQLQGMQNAQSELTDLKLLYSAYQNTNLPLKARKEAYKELQDLYPSYFGNIKFEQEASVKTKKAYDQLTTSILATARARAAADRIARNEERKLENEQKLIGLQKEQLKNQQKLDQAAKSANAQPLAGGATGGVATNIAGLQKSVSLEKKVTENLKSQNELKTDNRLLDEQSLRLVTYVADQQARGAKLTGDFGDALEKQVATIKKGRALMDRPFGVADTRTEALGGNISPRFKEITAQTSRSLALLRADFNYTDDEILNFISNYGYSLDTLLAKTVEFNTKISGAINNGLISAFEGIGTAIGNSLAEGANIAEALGNTLLGTFGDLLINLGKIAIETGVGIQAIKTALKSLNPAVAIGAGVALIALGSLIKGKLSNMGGSSNSGGGTTGKKNIPAFANGVTNFGGGMALVGEKGAELVNLPKGSDVIPNGQSTRIMQSAKSTTINLSGGIGISGRNLVLFLDDAYAQMGRTK